MTTEKTLTPYRNPIIPGFYPDPSVCRVGDDFYLVTSSFEFYPGVPVFHSRDLVHWHQIGHCLTRPSQLDLDGCPPSRGIWAATIRHHDGVFVMITTVMNHDTLRKFYVTAEDPSGPWSEPIWVDQPGIDPDLFFDDDGTVYLSSNGGPPERRFNLAVLDLRTGALLTEDRTVWGGSGGAFPEGPRLFKREGWYYLTAAEGGCQIGHMQTIARSRSPWGPYEPCPRNPILTHRHRGRHTIQGLGHMDFVQTPAGDWWATFLGYRLSRQYFYHLGRETFLAPVRWDADGWPVVGDDGVIEEEMSGPLPAMHPWPDPPARDDFDAPELGLGWNFLRNPDPASWSLTERPGSLTLHGNAASLDDVAAPAFAGRRQQHWHCHASALLDFAPDADDEAGLAAFYYNEHHYEVALICRDGRRRVIVRRRIGDLSAVVAEEDAPDGPVELMIQAERLTYHFGYRAAGEFRRLASGETRHLSCEAAPVGFTGVYFALYATGHGQPASAPAHFDWFDYVAADAGD